LILALTFVTSPQAITSSWVEIIGTLTLVSFVAGAYKHLECHISGCHRFGRFVHGHYKLCHLHHPGVPSDGKVTMKQIKEVVTPGR
jgi:hypothetical protein